MNHVYAINDIINPYDSEQSEVDTGLQITNNGIFTIPVNKNYVMVNMSGITTEGISGGTCNFFQVNGLNINDDIVQQVVLDDSASCGGSIYNFQTQFILNNDVAKITFILRDTPGYGGDRRIIIGVWMVTFFPVPSPPSPSPPSPPAPPTSDHIYLTMKQSQRTYTAGENLKQEYFNTVTVDPLINWEPVTGIIDIPNDFIIVEMSGVFTITQTIDGGSCSHMMFVGYDNNGILVQETRLDQGGIGVVPGSCGIGELVNFTLPLNVQNNVASFGVYFSDYPGYNFQRNVMIETFKFTFSPTPSPPPPAPSPPPSPPLPNFIYLMMKQSQRTYTAGENLKQEYFNTVTVDPLINWEPVTGIIDIPNDFIIVEMSGVFTITQTIDGGSCSHMMFVGYDNNGILVQETRLDQGGIGVVPGSCGIGELVNFTLPLNVQNNVASFGVYFSDYPGYNFQRNVMIETFKFTFEKK
ncbi:hypothetical protein PBCVCvsA1_019R [Paramecium bursaria Chlorella virus CvsA1]|nr:hypothetical protein PBCVCvsA1_019R [Paramecium bursaria Chlorella virus CvsA1]